ncbi:MAG: HD domain-containing protein [Clostridia bacterium]
MMMLPTEAERSRLLSFMRELERLKENCRTAWTSSGKRESIAEHSWRLAMFAFILEDYFPKLDFYKVVQLSLVHDLGEAFEGDVSATIAVNREEKAQTEEAALLRLSSLLPDNSRQKLLALWAEYNSGESKEARLVKALDKMETIIQHNQGKNPADFDYGFNLQYGKELAQFHPLLALLREQVDNETRKKMGEKQSESEK